MHPLRYIVILNYKNILNDLRQAHVMGFYAEIEDAENAIDIDMLYRIGLAKEDGESADNIHKGRNTLNISDNEYFSYDIHDLCAEDWTCNDRA